MKKKLQSTKKKIAKKFDPKKLGFLWLWILFYAIGAFAYIAIIAFIKPDKGSQIVTDINGILYLISMVLDALVVLFILSRRKSTKWLVLAVSIFGTMPSIIRAISGIETTDIFLELLFDVLPVIYFFKSKRAEATLTRTFNDETEMVSGKDEKFFNPRKLTFWRNVLMYFMLFAIVGHLLELIFCGTLLIFNPASYDPHSEVWTTFILKPFIVYGAGAVACILIFFPLRYLIAKYVKRSALVLPISFVINALICTMIEFIMGVTQNPYSEELGRRVLWDYSDQPFNFMGQVCLTNAIAFGIVSTLLAWVIYPKMEQLFIRIGKQKMMAISLALIVFMTAIFIAFGVDSSSFIGNDTYIEL